MELLNNTTYDWEEQKTSMRTKKTPGLLLILLVYIIAVMIGALVFNALQNLHLLLRLILADVCATTFVYLSGVILRNTSVYDPYWSVAPMVILLGLAIYHGQSGAGVVLLLLVIFYWGIRLTANWAYTFKNLDTQDWRYDMFKERFPRLFQLISYLGINIFPTVIVYLVLLPAVYFINSSSINGITILGFVIAAGSTTIQLFADLQMHRFKRADTNKTVFIRTGLWKYSRHPNYFGEIMMWWGVYVMMLSSLPNLWYLGIGAAANTLMFLFISIPMADKHNKSKREGFEQYKKETRSLLPLKKACDK